MDTDMFDKVPPELQPSTFDYHSYTAPDDNNWIPDITSSITYNSSTSLTDLGFVDTYHDVNDTALVPVVIEPMLPVDRTIELEVTFDTMDDGTNRAMFNQITYNSPLVPTTLSVLTLGPNATDVTAYGTTSFILDHLSAVQIIVKNGDAGKHPLCVMHFFVSLYVVQLNASTTATFMAIRYRSSIVLRIIRPATQL